MPATTTAVHHFHHSHISCQWMTNSCWHPKQKVRPGKSTNSSLQHQEALWGCPQMIPKLPGSWMGGQCIREDQHNQLQLEDSRIYPNHKQLAMWMPKMILVKNYLEICKLKKKFHYSGGPKSEYQFPIFIWIPNTHWLSIQMVEIFEYQTLWFGFLKLFCYSGPDF